MCWLMKHKCQMRNLIDVIMTGTAPVVSSMGIPQIPCPSFRRWWPRGWPDVTCTRKLSDALNVVEITPDVSILKFKIRHTGELSVLP
jgi:hypothetical protein